MTQGIKLCNLTIGYSGRVLAKNISISFGEGEFWTIIGPNGAGKSTLVKTILGIIPPLSGKIFIHGIDCTYRSCDERHFISYVPQMESYSHSFPATSLDVVLSGFFPRKPRFSTITNCDIEEAIRCMRLLDIEFLVDRPFNSLSGGQQRKVLIARAIVGSPHYIFLDEPTTGVDLRSSRKILKLISKLNKKEGFGILIVTHDINSVFEYTDMVIVMGDGKYVFGRKEQILNEEVLSFIYDVPVRVFKTDAGYAFLTGDKHV